MLVHPRWIVMSINLFSNIFSCLNLKLEYHLFLQCLSSRHGIISDIDFHFNPILNFNSIKNFILLRSIVGTLLQQRKSLWAFSKDSNALRLTSHWTQDTCAIWIQHSHTIYWPCQLKFNPLMSWFHLSCLVHGCFLSMILWRISQSISMGDKSPLLADQSGKIWWFSSSQSRLLFVVWNVAPSCWKCQLNDP